MAGLRERKKVQTRAAISAAALKLFAERGYDAVTVAEVAAAADVGERTLFRYFPVKEELLFGEDDVFRDALAGALAARPRDEPLRGGARGRDRGRDGGHRHAPGRSSRRAPRSSRPAPGYRLASGRSRPRSSP